MKYIFIAIISLTPLFINAQQKKIASTTSNKKGIGLAEKKGLGNEALEQLNVSWYYNWGATSNIETKAEFVPMIFSINALGKVIKSKILLGFNEPDNEKQSALSVTDALNSWNVIVAKASTVGSPATAGNPLKEDSWLNQFLNKKPKVDFIAVHWYKGCNASKFITEMTQMINQYGLPIWITEFAPQTVSDSKKDPDKYSTEEVNEFMKAVMQWMENEAMVQRYAWHDSKTGTSAIFNDDGSLTATGKFYSDFKIAK